MDFVLYDEPDAFWSTVAPVFEADPIRHTIALTVLSGLRVAGTDGFDAPLLVSITDGGSVVGAAFCTPPWPLGVSGVPVDVVPQLVEFLREREYTPSGVSGPRPPADAFAAAWGSPCSVLMNMRCYRLGELEPPEVPGELRLAEASDVPMLAGFEQEFMREAAHDPGGNYGQRVLQLVLGNAHGIWSDGGVVRAVARARRRGAVHRPGQPHVELDLPAHRLHPRLRRSRVSVRSDIGALVHPPGTAPHCRTSGMYDRGKPTAATTPRKLGAAPSAGWRVDQPH